jgi:hypothetical protein
MWVTFYQFHWNSKETKSRSAIASETQGIVKVGMISRATFGCLADGESKKLGSQTLRAALKLGQNKLH